MTDTTKERAQFENEDSFQAAWKKYDPLGNAGGWEKVAFTAGFGAGWMARAEQSTETPPKWGQTRQRDDLKPCPFCGTRAIQQGRLADNSTEQQWRIQCGNPFCERTCMTWVAAYDILP